LLRVDLGDTQGSREAYRHALALAPTNAKLHSNALLAMLYDPRVTPREIRVAAEDWNARHAASLAPIARAPRAQIDGRPLRVGYLSRDFRQHPIGFFLAGVLANHDRTVVHATCYSDNQRSDAWTQRLKASAHDWVDVADLDDMSLARRIASDKIDILIELGGHTGSNRLLVCARRPAPVQATWLGYPATTGLRAIDYFISDRHETPPGCEDDYVETLIRLPDGYLCYTPPDDASAVGPLPASISGAVTFGCLNNPAKINESALTLWAQILAAIPRSRLLVLAAADGERDTLTRVQAVLQAHGIDSARVELVTRRPHVQLLDVYNRIDVALDPISYTGGLTTCEALWMGVPVVTLAGATFPARHSLTHLTIARLPDFVTNDRDAYARRAIEAATDLDRLAKLRAGLRARVAASPLGDCVHFTRHFEAALRTMVAAKR
jgi:predicted O-linked N-acetylglucosamine transferase (SPINDLY family)